MSAVELATAYIALVPSAKGIAAGIAAEMGTPVEKAAAESAEKAGGSFASSFAKAGKLAAVGLAAGVAALAAVGGTLFKIGADFDDAFDKIRTETGATGEKLDGLKGDFRGVFASVPTDMTSASEAIAGVNQKLGLSGAPLQEVSKQVLELTRLTGSDLKGNIDSTTGVLNNWGVATKDQGRRLDELFRASQATGVSVADLSGTMAKSGSTLRQVGFSFEDSAAVIGLLSKAGVDAGAVMPALSKSVAAAAKEGKTASDVFRDTFNAIKNAPTDTAAAGAAIDVFGAKAGPNLAGLIRQGKLSYEELSKSIAGGKDTILGAAADTNDFAEKWTLFKNKALLALEPVAIKVFDFVSILTDRLGPIMLQISGIITDDLGAAFRFVNDHIDIIGPLLAGLAITIGVPLVAAFVSWAIAAGAAAVATVVAAAPVIAITVAIALLVAGIIYAYQHFQIFRDVVDTLGRIIKTEFAIAIEYAKFIIGVLVDYVQLIIRVVGDVIKGVVALFHGDWKGAWAAFGDIPKAAIEFIGSIIDRFIGMVGGIGKRIAGATGGMFDGIKDAFRGAINFIIGAWNGLQFKLPAFDTHIPGVGKVGGFTLGTEPKIPFLADGGTATSAGLAIVGERGPELLSMHAGATVAPLQMGGPGSGGAAVYNITVQAGVGDPRAIGEEVVRFVQAYEQGAGNGWRNNPARVGG